MKVILLQDVKNLGKINDVVEVSDGYAKNFLLKKRYAVAYTNQAKSVLSKNLQTLSNNEQEKVLKAKELKNRIEEVTLNFKLKTNKGKVFGEISHKSIIEKLSLENNIKIDKYMFKEKERVSIGKHNIKLLIYKNVDANLKVIVEEQHDKKN